MKSQIGNFEEDEHRAGVPLEYQSVQAGRGEEVESYLGPSILAMVLLFPVGVMAVVNSMRARRAAARGEGDVARYYAANASQWGAITMVVWMVLLVGFFVVATVFRIWL